MTSRIYQPGELIRAVMDIRMMDTGDRASIPAGTLGIVTVSNDGSRQLQAAFVGYGLAVVYAYKVEGESLTAAPPVPAESVMITPRVGMIARTPNGRGRIDAVGDDYLIVGGVQFDLHECIVVDVGDWQVEP